jgi:hypothetical protein
LFDFNYESPVSSPKKMLPSAEIPGPVGSKRKLSEEEEYAIIEKRQRTDEMLMNPDELLNSPGDLLDGFDDFLKSPEEEEAASAFGIVNSGAGTASSSRTEEIAAAPLASKSLDNELRGIEALYGITTSVQEAEGDGLVVECVFSTLSFIFSLSSRKGYEEGPDADKGGEDDEFDFLASFTGEAADSSGDGLLLADVRGGDARVMDGIRERIRGVGVVGRRIGEVLGLVWEGV